MTAKTTDDASSAGGDGCEPTVCLPQDVPVDAVEPPAYYGANEDLPADVRNTLPAPVQTLYRQAFNTAWNRRLAPVRRAFIVSHDAVATRAAWKAVRRLYVQHGTTWVRRKSR